MAGGHVKYTNYISLIFPWKLVGAEEAEEPQNHGPGHCPGRLALPPGCDNTGLRPTGPTERVEERLPPELL